MSAVALQTVPRYEPAAQIVQRTGDVDPARQKLLAEQASFDEALGQ